MQSISLLTGCMVTKMIEQKIPIGISNFAKIREDGYYYIDKSGLISDLLRRQAEVTLITRPRRFGKTLAMSMLESFFDIRKDSKALFEGLQITKDRELCDAWMNQYPTLFLTFKDVDGLTFASAKEMLRQQIAQICDEHFYLLSGDSVSENDKAALRQLADTVHGTPTDAALKTSLALLMRMMQAYYGKPVILLLDEYDVPMAKASIHGYYAPMLEIIRSLLSTALKDNTSLKFAVVTGCLRISKESIFTGTNNFVSDTVSDTRLDEYFGFVAGEVDRLLKDMGQEERKPILRKWYDGYHFGEFDVYCPWDVLSYLYKLQLDPKAQPEGFWKNTSDNAIIRSFIDQKGNAISEKLEILLAGGYIRQEIAEDLTYDYLHASEDNLWSVLYLTGYLTRLRESDLSPEEWNSLTGNELALVIPNEEIRDIFRTTIQKWFADYAQTSDRRALFDAVWDGDASVLTSQMNTLLRQTISYHDYKEDFYHAFLAGIFAGGGFMVESNREHGEGRSDVVVKDKRGGRIAVFEVKCVREADQMARGCDAALHQIDERMYAQEYEDSYEQVLCYGIAFYKKRCMVKRK